ncbi:MAG TPA: hypothetical protein VGG56_05410 [Terracidiphilus sp.]
MCPFCLATAAWVAAAAVSTGGLAALVLKKAATGSAAKPIPATTPATIKSTKEDHHG